MNLRILFLYCVICASAVLISCKKTITDQSITQPPPIVPPPAGDSFQLSYGDSIFYLSATEDTVIVNPIESKIGKYFSFPEGLEIDSATGAINIGESEAGMRYRVTYKNAAGDSSNAYIVISGINFPDKYYYVDQNDTMAFPVYNADPAKELPKGNFDEDRVANNSGCAMRTTNGQINLTESIRNGLFGDTPKNDTRKDFEVRYSLDDKSGKAGNKIKILLYYYDKSSDVPADLTQTVKDHQAMTLLPNNSPISNNLISAAAKPRPPCIIVIAHK